MSSDVERVKEAIDPIAFISTYTPLKRRGNTFWGLSPFTNEKTPSFTVRPDGLFYCFSTNVGGDILRFIELKEGLGFREALTRAAEFAGITLTDAVDDARTVEKQAQKADGYELLATARAYFHRLLLDSGKAEQARKTLEQRNFDQDSWIRFELGYAWGEQEDWTELVRKKNWSLSLSRDIGLTHPNQNRDRFRHRLMFPILDTRGNTAGFGGRRLHEDEPAKYINSADSQWFHKGQLLFGYTQAQPTWRTEKTAILCEGYTDVMRLHTHGFTTAVAPLGTAITPQQAARIAAHVQKATLAFDADQAGFKAALNAWALLVQRGTEVHLLDLPPGEDPDSFADTHGRQEVQNRLEQAPPFWPMFLERRVHGNRDTADKRRQIDQVVDKLASFQDRVLAELLVDELAAAAGVSASAILRDLQRLQRDEQKSRPPATRHDSSISKAEEALATWILQHPDQRFALIEQLSGQPLHRYLMWVLHGGEEDEPGYRNWLGQVANQSLQPLDPGALIQEVIRKATEREKKRQIQQLAAEEKTLRAEGKLDQARELTRKIDALLRNGATVDSN